MLPPLSKNEAILPPLLAASVFPDAVDKFLGYGLKVMPDGRHVAHNLFSLIGLSIIVAFVWGKAAGCAWFAGYSGHLLADQNSRVPWLFPVQKYVFVQKSFSFNWSRFLQEMVLLLLVMIVYHWGNAPRIER